MKYKKGILYCPTTRRQFLAGTGKSLLALPILPSLIPGGAAFAQTNSSPKRMMTFFFDHNSIFDCWPSDSVATRPIGNMGIKYQELSQMGSVASHTFPLSHPIFEKLKNSSQLTYLRGLRQPSSDGTHGNYFLAAASARKSSDQNLPTIDSIIESSTSVYPSGTPLEIKRAMRVQLAGGASAFYKKVGSSTQSLPTYSYYRYENFYNDIFGSLSSGSIADREKTNQLKGNILNRVLGSYNSYRSNSVISNDDKVRLTQHMDSLSDIQRSYASVQASLPTCPQANPGAGTTTDRLVINQLLLQLMAAAFKCGYSKYGAYMFEGHNPLWIPNLGTANFHDAIHGSQGGDVQLTAFQNWWKYNCDMMADNFLAPLDEEEGSSGRTYIDNMIINLSATGGINAKGNGGAHWGNDSQHIMLGTMGGAIQGGRYYSLKVGPHTRNDTYPYNSLLITQLQLMGVQPSEYASATSNGKGFGSYTGYSSNYHYNNRLYSPIDEILT